MTTILIVEDDPAIRGFLAELLLDEGYLTTSAENGRKALEALHLLQPDLIITDIMMPEMTGLELCAQVKGEPSTAMIPVIVYTAGQNSALITQCRCDAFFTKPFTITTVLTTIASVLPDQP